MLTSARRGLAYPNPDRSDRPDIPAHLLNLINGLEIDMIFAQGTAAARAVRTHLTGVFFYETDTGLSWYDDGAAWHQVGLVASNIVLSGTYAARPAANTVGAGTLYWCTDYKCFLRSDATNWTRVTPAQIAKVTPKTVNTSTSEADLLNGEGTIPGGLIGINGRVRFRPTVDQLNNTGGSVTFQYRAKLGASTFFDSGAFSIAPSANRQAVQFEALLQNLGVANSQSYTGQQNMQNANGLTPAALGTGEGGRPATGWQSSSTEDTSADRLLVFTIQMGTSSAQAEAKLLSALIEIF